MMELLAGNLKCPGSGVNLNPQCNIAEILWLIDSKGFLFVVFLEHWGKSEASLLLKLCLELPSALRMFRTPLF